MARTIEECATTVLEVLSNAPRDGSGRSELSGKDICDQTGLSPAEVNDAVSLLVENGYAEWIQTLGTHPYIFNRVMIAPRGRYEAERIETEQEVTTTNDSNYQGPIPVVSPSISLPPTPVGSPYGFNDEDWETVSLRKSKPNELYVVLGYQFSSEYYDSVKLTNNTEAMFINAVEAYNSLPNSIQVDLLFKPLEAGYGEHLFNEIARDIISSDIAIFETSDLNSNVMLEMGVALTWGVRVLPIKHQGRPKPPSDISGQTWADYSNDASKFIDNEHQNKLVRMIERSVGKKKRANG